MGSALQRIFQRANLLMALRLSQGVLLVLFLVGGEAAAPAALHSVASAVGSISTAAGLTTSPSTVELNRANKDLIMSQAAMMQAELATSAREHDRVGREGRVMAKLLRDMSETYGDPVFLMLAE
jgi:hypothetical protein